MEKMTSAEYEKMFKSKKLDSVEKASSGNAVENLNIIQNASVNKAYSRGKLANF